MEEYKSAPAQRNVDRDYNRLTPCTVEEYESRAGTTTTDRFEVPTARGVDSTTR